MRNELNNPINASCAEVEQNERRDELIGDPAARRLAVLRPGKWAGFPHTPPWYAVGDRTRIVALFVTRCDAERFAQTSKRTVLNIVA